MEPPAAQRFGSRFGLIPVAFHDPVAPRDDLSYRFAVGRHIYVSIVHYAHFDARVGNSGHRLDGVLLFVFNVDYVIDVSMRMQGRSGRIAVVCYTVTSQ